jgi:hypothetical protein
MLDHIMRTPVPNDVRVAHLGTLNSSFIRRYSNHFAQRISFAIEKNIPLVTQGNKCSKGR